MFRNAFIALAAAIVALQGALSASDCSKEGCSFSLCDSSTCAGWTLYSDWIFWHTRRCDLDYALKTTDGNPRGKVKALDLDYEGGFRLAALKCCGAYDFGLHFTHFTACADDSTDVGASGNILKTRLGEQYALTSDGSIAYAKGEYDLSYNVYDLEGGYGYQHNKCICSRFFGGLRFAFIDQDFDVTYKSIAGTPTFTDKIRHTCDMDAYGIYAGAKTSYALSRCLSLFGTFSSGVLVAEFDRKFTHKGVTVNEESTNTVTYVKIKDSCTKLVGTIDAALGLQYATSNFTCLDWRVSLGYEFHQWLNTRDFMTLVTGDTSGEIHFDHHDENLGFDGLFLRVAASF